MRQNIHGSQDTRRARAGKVLFSVLRKVGKSNAQKISPDCRVRELRQAVQEVQGRDRKESGQQALLFSRLLVLLQPAGQSLSLDRWSTRQIKSRGHCLAQSSIEAGQAALSDLPREEASRSPSHLSVWYSSRAKMGSCQRINALSQLPYWFQAQRNGLRRNTQVYSIRTCGGVVC